MKNVACGYYCIISFLSIVFVKKKKKLRMLKVKIFILEIILIGKTNRIMSYIKFVILVGKTED